MSSTHRRQNSTDPRPGSTAFPRTSLFNKTSPTRPGTSTGRSWHARADSGSSRVPPRAPTVNTSAAQESATKTQMNQTLSIAMMSSCPANPLPFFLPVPLGVTMLLMGSNTNTNNRATANPPPQNNTARRR